MRSSNEVLSPSASAPFSGSGALNFSLSLLSSVVVKFSLTLLTNVSSTTGASSPNATNGSTSSGCNPNSVTPSSEAFLRRPSRSSRCLACLSACAIRSSSSRIRFYPLVNHPVNLRVKLIVRLVQVHRSWKHLDKLFHISALGGICLNPFDYFVKHCFPLSHQR